MTTKEPSPVRHVIERPAVQSWRILFETMRVVLNQLESGLQREGMSVARFQIMFHLYFSKQLAPSQIAERMLVTRGNISTFLRRMTQDGLVEPADHRASRPKYQLTKKGRDDFEALLPEHVERIEKLVLPLSQSTLAELSGLHEHVSATTVVT